MSAAPVSRSSALPEITPPSRRSPERSEPEQAFALPPEPVERPRPRVEDDRNSRDSAETREPSKSDDGARREAAAETKSPARADEAGKDRKAAGAAERSDKAKTEPGTDEASTKDAAAPEGKKTETAAGDKPAAGKTIEERKAALAAMLDGAPVIKDPSQEQAVAVVAPQPVPVPSVSAEFLALAALTLQGGEQAKPDGAATPESKPEGQTVVATGAAGAAVQPMASGVAVPVPAALVKIDGQGSAGGEAAVTGVKAGVTAQLPAAGVAIKAETKPGEAQQGDAKPVDGQAVPKESAEAGKATTVPTGAEVKAAEPTTAGQPAQPATSDNPAQTTTTQQAAAPLSPQAILAAGPQSLATPQAPLTELDAAAQATAQAQAEATHRMISGDTGRATPLHVVPVEIGARALAGNKRFDIRLDPAELGRIDVRLEFSDKGEVSAKLTVDRVETLHMLQRDARTLERAFEQAGLKPSEGGIDMSLRDSSDQQAGTRQQRQDDETPRGRRAWVQATDDSALITEAATLPRTGGRLGGVDLSI
ncbi:flagellar hook-length control protein FliK [Bosea sp. LjRoot90]|uniref:flagellar hook-length control protein FliK n=1 Tax=Bosea sp. LjRoot90 TaxID=3342342 RepID=UPI003ECDDD44